MASPELVEAVRAWRAAHDAWKKALEDSRQAAAALQGRWEVVHDTEKKLTALSTANELVTLDGETLFVPAAGQYFDQPCYRVEMTK